MKTLLTASFRVASAALVPIAVILTLSTPMPAAAQTLTLDTPNLIVNTAQADQTYTFRGLLTNTFSQPLFFNGDLLAVDPALLGDDSVFINTFVLPADPAGNPLPQPALGAGQSLDVPLFTITLPQDTPLGTYDGTFQVQGGFTASDYGILGTAQAFTVTTTPDAPPLPAVPEATTSVSLGILMTLGGLLTAWKAARKRASGSA